MYEQLQTALCYRFSDPALLRGALTHSSYANENKNLKIQCNERLEFLGDSILGFVVADELYRRFPDRPEEGDVVAFCQLLGSIRFLLSEPQITPSSVLA